MTVSGVVESSGVQEDDDTEIFSKAFELLPEARLLPGEGLYRFV